MARSLPRTLLQTPFLDYRLSVSFAHQASGESRVVPGFFAADGDAAESSATAGNSGEFDSRLRSPANGSGGRSFDPDREFAINDSSGESTAFDGDSGAIAVGAAPADAPGFSAKGF